MGKLKAANKLTNHGLIRRALNDVNRIRMALAYTDGTLAELPKGVIGDEKQCVLARALSNGWRASVEAGATSLDYSPQTGKRLTLNETCEKIIKAAESLEQVGFKINNKEDILTGEDISIIIRNTDAMDELVTRFDNVLLPDLILKD